MSAIIKLTVPNTILVGFRIIKKAECIERPRIGRIESTVVGLATLSLPLHTTRRHRTTAVSKYRAIPSTRGYGLLVLLPKPQGHYPYAKQCPNGWMKVVPSLEPPDEEDHKYD
ncbi:MAG: hypothetical protein ACLPX5_00455 [Dissulfurispiraceae bacterium]